MATVCFYDLKFRIFYFVFVMGCLCAHSKKDEFLTKESDSNKEYSWDKRKESNFNPSDFIIENLTNQDVVKAPGSVNGQQFIIQNCNKANIYVLDHMNTVTVDDCNDCNIILGPVKGSVFLRNCKGCNCVTSCGQFRARDSRKLHVFLYCATQPIIEASSRIYFGKYLMSYRAVEAHLAEANLNLNSQTWDTIHDFTPLETETNWSFVGPEVTASAVVGDCVTSQARAELETWGVSWQCPVGGPVHVKIEEQTILETTI